MPYAYAFPTILQSATLETGALQARICPLIPARARQISALEDRIRSLTVMMYRSTILIPSPAWSNMEQHGIIHIISYRFENSARRPKQDDCMESRRRKNRRAYMGSHRAATVAGRSTLASADEVDARPRSTSSLTRQAFVRFHSHYRNAPYALCYSSGLSSRSPNYLTTA